MRPTCDTNLLEEFFRGKPDENSGPGSSGKTGVGTEPKSSGKTEVCSGAGSSGKTDEIPARRFTALARAHVALYGFMVLKVLSYVGLLKPTMDVGKYGETRYAIHDVNIGIMDRNGTMDVDTARLWERFYDIPKKKNQ